MSTEIAASDLSARVADFDISEAPDMPDIAAPEYACEVCGTELFYSGRGRKPKRCDEHKTTRSQSAGSKRGSKDVEAAVSSLNQVYTLVQMGLRMLNADLANEAMSASLPKLEASNREHLTNDPELAKRIADMGKTGGRYAFFSAQLLTIGPVLFLAYSELSQRRAEKQGEAEQAWGDVPATNVSGFPV
jgi:hypothetical protein